MHPPVVGLCAAGRMVHLLPRRGGGGVSTDPVGLTVGLMVGMVSGRQPTGEGHFTVVVVAAAAAGVLT